MTDTAIRPVDRLRKQALDLSLLGMRQVDIAAKLGVTQPRVSQLLAEARREWREEGAKSYEEHVSEALARCELLINRLKDGIDAGDPRSIEAAGRLNAQIGNLLGLNHRDRISERAVQVEEAKVKIVGRAVAAMLDHLGIEGSQRDSAISVLQRELESAETVS